MSSITRFVKFNRCKRHWGNHKPAELGTHIDYCESHIDKCEQVIADQNAEILAFRNEILVLQRSGEQSIQSSQVLLAEIERLNCQLQEAQEKEAVAHSDTSASRSSKRAKQAHNSDEEFIDQGKYEDPPPSHSSHSEPLCCCICGKEDKWLATNPRRRDDMISICDTDGSTSCDLLVQKDYSSLNGFFYFHLSCMKGLKNESRESTSRSIWKSSAFMKIIDVDLKERVVEQGYCIDMSNLNRIFIRYLKDEDIVPESEVVSNQNLKDHILKFENMEKQITFLKPRNAASSEVIINNAGRSNAADCFHLLTDIYELQERANLNPSAQPGSFSRDSIIEDKSEWVHTTVRLCHLLNDTRVQNSTDISFFEMNEQFTPSWLINFLAFITHSTEHFATDKDWAIMANPEFCSPYEVQRVPIAPAHEACINAIAQDLLYLRSKGHYSTPKHLGLAVWIWHTYKSSELIHVLHALGYCVSYTTLMRYITDIAEKKQASKVTTPVGVALGIPILVAGDNLDFKIETLSGAGQKHIFSSLICQYSDEDSQTIQMATIITEKNINNKRHSKQFTPEDQVITLCGKGSPDITPFKLGADLLTPHDRQLNADIPSDKEIASELAIKYTKLDTLISVLKFSWRKLGFRAPLPDWIGTNMLIDFKPLKKSPPPCTLHTGPMIDADPNSPATINHFLKKVMDIRREIGLAKDHHTPVTFDMGLYSKALPIINSNPEYNYILPMVGEMHTLMSFHGIIGCITEGSGFDDIVKRAGIVAEASMPNVLSGKMVNRANRTYAIMGEVLEYLRCEEYRDSLGQPELQDAFCEEFAKAIQSELDPRIVQNEELGSILQRLPNLRKIIFSSNDTDEVSSVINRHLDAYAQRVALMKLQCKTYSFWSLIIDLINLSKLHSRAVKSATSQEFMWLLYIESLEQMLPYFHYYNHINYKRYLSWFVMNVRFLKETRPNLYHMFSEGKFAARRNSHNNFSDCPMDQSLEHGPNRDAKVSGGIGRGRIQRIGGMERWILSLPEISAISGSFYRNIAGLDHQDRLSKHLDKTNISKHESLVIEAIRIVSEEMTTNPFVGIGQLINISTGIVASDDIAESYAECHAVGSRAENKLSLRWCVAVGSTAEPLAKMSEAIPKNNVRTFSKPNAKKISLPNIDQGKLENSTIMKLPPSQQFAKSILFGLMIGDDVLSHRVLMSYPLCKYPASIAIPTTGLFYQTDKAGLRADLIRLVGENSNITTSSEQRNIMMSKRSGFYIVDLMKVLVAVSSFVDSSKKQGMDTFEYFLLTSLKKMVNAANEHGCATLHIVPDIYKPGSTKSMERECRTTGTVPAVTNISSMAQKLPISSKAMKSFMSSGVNKNELVNLLFHVALKHFSQLDSQLDDAYDLEIFIGNGEECIRIFKEEGNICQVPIQELYCDHEEADTRLIFHALYVAHYANLHELMASDSPLRIIIASEDTDTMVIAVRHALEIATIFGITLATAATIKSKLKFCMHINNLKLSLVDIFQIAHSLGNDLCMALPGMHAVTGCDTVSYFKLKGKSMPWKIFMENRPRFTSALIALGETLTESLSENCLSGLEAFICRFYPHKGRILEKVNDVRELYLKPQNNLASDESFPPAQVCLQQHFLRAQYQTFQWCHASVGRFHLPSPISYGFEEVDNKLRVKWFTGDMLPQELHTKVFCNCKTGCKSKICGCRKLNLLCNEDCKCGEGCTNCATHATETEDLSEGESSDKSDTNGDSDVDSVSSSDE